MSYTAAFEKAAALLQSLDFEALYRKTGAIEKNGSISLRYFNETVGIHLPEVDFYPSSINFGEKILILHYLTTPGDTPTKGEFVNFKNLPNASFYDPTYQKRGPLPLLNKFGNKPEGILRALDTLEGVKESLGDISIRIPIFPKIESIVVFYKGDDEFPPSVSILFNDG
ncbi:MAG: DUF3786 domain-containing protein, partial [Spirochaetota bacterium]